MRLFFEIATRGPIVRRALVMALVVGPVLISINHGRCVMAGKFDAFCFLSSLLTLFVPYVVSTVSSVLACGRSEEVGTK